MPEAARRDAGFSGPDVRVDLHCHSDCSDGYYPPRVLADMLAEAGVQFAALTDHGTTAGLAAFHRAAARHGFADIPGTEISATFDGVEVHLLAYGFRPESRAIRELYAGAPDAGQAIRGIHDAGGIAFLAHPLQTGWSLEELEAAVTKLVDAGLDGIEAFHRPYPADTQSRLVDLADRLGVLTCGGSDFHGPKHAGSEGPGVTMETGRWKRFREALGDHARAGAHGSRHDPPAPRRTHEINWRWLFLRIVLPSLLVIGFFMVLLFAVLIPTMEHRLLERKREMTSELTNSAWSILSDFDRAAREGRLDPAEAQREAAERVRRLRYGPEGMDYFWITDLHPRMVMHPYRPDLEGTDLTDVTDPDGVRPFVEFVKAVRNGPSGYVRYVWQWLDDPERLAAKESYVRLFEPWGWVIGTGLYEDDVRREIEAITGRMIDASFIVTVLAAVLLLTVAWQSLKVERRRSEAEHELRLSHEKYRTLVESSAGGTLLLLDGRCTYANRTVLDMLGYTAEELAFLDLHDVVLADEGGAGTASLELVSAGGEVRVPFEARLRRRDGATVAVLLSSTPVYFSGRRGLILTVQDIARHREMQEQLGESLSRYEALAQNLSSAVFRAAMDDTMTFLEMNPAARRLLAEGRDETAPAGLREVMPDRRAHEELVRRLHTDGSVRDTLLQVRKGDGTVATVNLSAVMSRRGSGEGAVCDAVMEDISARRRSEAERESLIAQLQASLLFLTEPVGNSMVPAVRCTLDTPIAGAVRLMSRHTTDALAVVGPSDELLGIVTDHDIRERVVAAGIDTGAAVSRIMTAPAVSVPESAPLFEAFVLERERGIGHLAVTDGGGNLVGMIRSSRAVRLDRYSPVVLTGRIRRARTVEELAECHALLPTLVGSLVDAGALPRNLCHVTTAASDAIADRVVSLAIGRLGPPPARFALVALGSEAREEQTLATDQDNALIYEAPAGADSSAAAAAAEYFLDFGRFFCEALDRAGYRYCRGGVMANNPAWNQGLAQWKRYFGKWIAEPDAQEIAHCNIFFDMRSVYGDGALVRELWTHVAQVLAAHPAFLSHMALSALQYKPPIGMFGQIVTGGAGASPNTFDVKDAMVPIVNFARLYGLQKHVEPTNTIDRLDRLRTEGVLQEESHRGLTQAYGHLMQLRFRHQVRSLKSGADADNAIDPRSLTQIELGMLKNTFSQIAVIQKKVSFDFRGSA